MGGVGHDVEVVDFGSFGVGGGFDGRDEKRFTPGSDATMAINKNQAFLLHKPHASKFIHGKHEEADKKSLPPSFLVFLLPGQSDDGIFFLTACL